VSFLDGCFSVQMNGTDMIQILMNLVVNAFQSAGSPIEVEVDGRVTNEPIPLDEVSDGQFERTLNLESFSNHPPMLMLTVRDTGPGIPADVLPQIFRPYYTTKRSEEGTGLGLSIILRLIKEANGALHVRTQPGEGTTFTVYLPVSPVSSCQ
jgi:signal transduction histidine kinase